MPEPYTRRVVDDELDELLAGLPAVSIDGPKGVGKTTTALQRATELLALDDDEALAALRADPGRIERAAVPTLIDEWQRWPGSWDRVRRAVDADRTPGRFLLTGSAAPATPSAHSGAGRIVRLRMRPMSLVERGVSTGAVSLAELLRGDRAPISGRTDVVLGDYVHEIVGGGLPPLRSLSPRLARAAWASYVDLVLDRDLPEAGHAVRNPVLLRRWLTSLAAATATTASFESIRDGASGGQTEPPARSTTIPYRDALERIWVYDPIPAWAPSQNRLSRLVAGPKHFLADPALAAALLALDETTLGQRATPQLGALFEALVALDLQVYAQAAGSRVHHLRTRGGDHEIDFMLTGAAGRVLAVETKLTATVDDRDVRHLHWLAQQIGDDLIDAVVVTTGREAYRRADGIAVVPAALLGA